MKKNYFFGLVVFPTTLAAHPKLVAVESKNVYGNPLYYPVSEAAKLLASIAGTKTLSAEVLGKAEDLGLEVALYVDN